MNIPVQISFHELPPTPSLEEAALRFAEGLEKVHHGITSIHVAIEEPHRHHHQGRLFRVRLEIAVPGRIVVVGRAHDDAGAHADAHVALHDAFRAARRQLADDADRRREHRGTAPIGESGS